MQYFVIKISDLVKTEMKKSVEMFLGKGVKLPKIINTVYEEGGMPVEEYENKGYEDYKEGCIYKYKIGAISTEDFIAAVNEKLEVELTEEEFTTCWNAMNTMDEAAIENIRQLFAALESNDNVHILVIGRTNPLHHDHFFRQLSDNELRVPLDSITFINSFDCQILDADELRYKAVADICDDESEVIDLRNDNIDMESLIEKISASSEVRLDLSI